MPGPAPKPAAIRQRRNKTVGRAALPAETSPRKRAPQLPRLEHREWSKMTKKWWRDVWGSPMAQEYLRADEHALFRLALLVDMYWREPSVALAREIRIEQQAFGLTPLDRRRLEWEIERVEEAKDQRDRRRVKRAIVISGDDPREALA